MAIEKDSDEPVTLLKKCLKGEKGFPFALLLTSNTNHAHSFRVIFAPIGFLSSALTGFLIFTSFLFIPRHQFFWYKGTYFNITPQPLCKVIVTSELNKNSIVISAERSAERVPASLQAYQQVVLLHYFFFCSDKRHNFMTCNCSADVIVIIKTFSLAACNAGNIFILEQTPTQGAWNGKAAFFRLSPYTHRN